jgi:hypothetical protein
VGTCVHRLMGHECGQPREALERARAGGAPALSQDAKLALWDQLKEESTSGAYARTHTCSRPCAVVQVWCMP